MKKYIQPILLSSTFLVLVICGYYDVATTTSSYLVGFFQALGLVLLILQMRWKKTMLFASLFVPLLIAFSFVTGSSPVQYGVAFLGSLVFTLTFIPIQETISSLVKKRYTRYFQFVLPILCLIPWISPLHFFDSSIFGLVDTKSIVYIAGLFFAHTYLLPRILKKSKTKILAGILCFILVWGMIVERIPNKTLVDLSTHHSFTLSPTTEKSIQTIPQTIEIRLYLTPNVPEKLVPIVQYVRLFVDQYAQQRPDKIIVSVVDPTNDTKMQDYLLSHDIHPIGYKEQKGEKEITRDIYLAAELMTSSKSIFIPQLLKTQTLEYQLTSGIQDLSSKEKGVALVGFPDEMLTKGSVLYTFYTQLQQSYHVDRLSPNDSLSGYSAILGMNIAQGQSEAVEKALSGTVSMILFQEGAHVTTREGNGLQADTSLASESAFLSQYGIAVSPALVLSKSSDTIAFANSGGSFYVQYPFAVRTDTIVDQSLSDKVPQGLVFPWVSRLVLHNPQIHGWKTTPLVFTTKDSWTQTSPFTLFPSDILIPSTKSQQKQTIAAYATNGKSSLVVIPTTYFLQAPFIGINSGNYDFVFGLLHQMMNADHISGLVSKDLSPSAFAGFTTAQHVVFIMLTLFGTVVPWTPFIIERAKKKKVLSPNTA